GRQVAGGIGDVGQVVAGHQGHVVVAGEEIALDGRVLRHGDLDVDADLTEARLDHGGEVGELGPFDVSVQRAGEVARFVAGLSEEVASSLEVLLHGLLVRRPGLVRGERSDRRLSSAVVDGARDGSQVQRGLYRPTYAGVVEWFLTGIQVQRRGAR